jgi:hypothetical protein
MVTGNRIVLLSYVANSHLQPSSAADSPGYLVPLRHGSLIWLLPLVRCLTNAGAAMPKMEANP